MIVKDLKFEKFKLFKLPAKTSRYTGTSLDIDVENYC